MRLALAAIAVTVSGSVALAQTSATDSLIDKLVQKGILTTAEAKQLREEAAKEAAKNTSQFKNALPDWVTAIKLSGDFRGRYEGQWSDNDAAHERDRFRYRLRLGATVSFLENYEVGMRLTSADSVKDFSNSTGNPLSGSSTFQDDGSKKFVYIDLAYAKWKALDGPTWNGVLTFGKMENPFAVSYSVFDPDYTPEGLAWQGAYNFNEHHALKLNLGGFVLDEVSTSTSDPYLVGGQIIWDAKWNEQWQTSLGVALMKITSQQNLTNGAVPNVNTGNTRTGSTGVPAESFSPVITDGSVTYTLDSFPAYHGPFPIKVSGEYLNNTGANSKNIAYMAGVTLGKAGKKGLWEIGYQYRYVEADSWYEELPDDDFGGYYQAPLPHSGFSSGGYVGGTNVRGHIIRALYSPYNFLTLGVTFYDVSLIDSSPSGSKSNAGHIFVDALLRF